MHPLTADPRIRINAFSMHETFNAPTSLATSTIPSRFPSATFSTFNQIHPSSLNTPQIHRSQANSNANLANGNAEQQQQQQFEGHQYVFFLSIPPPPSYQESIQALPPSYENISNLP
uniref:Uncharacterized protein n=1 Tax=Panagrolaimus superbus TaxID=310955 RepID=A0A914Z6C7_9BILA